MKVLVIKSRYTWAHNDIMKIKEDFEREMTETVKKGYLFMPQHFDCEVVEIDAVSLESRTEATSDFKSFHELAKRYNEL